MNFQPKSKGPNMQVTPVSKEVPSAIFLDLEGPIVTHDSVIANTSASQAAYSGGSTWRWIDWVDPIALKLVHRLAVDFNSQIVLTSVLRREERVVSQLYDFLRQLADREGVDTPYAGVTPHGRTREAEIREYIKTHNVKKFAVIDDRKLLIENFVLVGFAGFRVPEYEQCKWFLFDDTKHSEDLLKRPLVLL